MSNTATLAELRFCFFMAGRVRAQWANLWTQPHGNSMCELFLLIGRGFAIRRFNQTGNCSIGLKPLSSWQVIWALMNFEFWRFPAVHPTHLPPRGKSPTACAQWGL